jgi:hypothetical protein
LYKDIIILSSSFKHDGRCIAGIDAETGDWIRLYSSNLATEGAVPLNQLIYENGSMVSIYDVVRVNLTMSCPTLVQPENWHYDESEKWELIRKSNLHEVIHLHGFDRPKTIFKNTENKLPGDTVFDSEPSLLLIKLVSPEVFIKTFDSKKVQLCFTYNGDEYRYFKITDIEINNKYSDHPDGGIRLNGIIPAVFSLTDKYKLSGKYYKVVAQILE